MSFRRFFKLGDASYKELAGRVIRKVNDDDCFQHAAAMAYYLLLALFPFLLFLTTLIGYLPVSGLLDFILGTFREMMPEQVFMLVQDHIRSLFGTRSGGLLSLGFLMALWTSSSAVTSFMNVMNHLHGVKEGRPFWKVRLVAFLLVISLSFLFLSALLMLMVGPGLGGWIAIKTQLGPLFLVVWNLALLLVTFYTVVLAVAVIYHYTPDVRRDWQWLSLGSVISIPAWIITSLCFSFYINNFGSYNKTYGSIGAVIVLMLWLYLSGFIFLVGAEINSVIDSFNRDEGQEPPAAAHDDLNLFQEGERDA